MRRPVEDPLPGIQNPLLAGPGILRNDMSSDGSLVRTNLIAAGYSSPGQ